jgi:hypothetical protein
MGAEKKAGALALAAEKAAPDPPYAARKARR